MRAKVSTHEKDRKIGGASCLQVIFRSYFFADFFFFPFVFLGTIVASNLNRVDFLFKFMNFIYRLQKEKKGVCARLNQ